MAQLIAQPREEKQLKAFARFACEQTKIRFQHAPFRLSDNILLAWKIIHVFPVLLVRLGLQTKTAQYLFQRAGKFPNGHRHAFEIVLEIVEHGAGGVLEKFRVELADPVTAQLNGNHFGRKRDAFAVTGLEQQAIECERDHCLASSFLTSCTKSVASWNRRYTLA